MRNTNITFAAYPELYDALQSYIKDEREESGVKVSIGQVITRIVVAYLRKEGYLTNKPKAKREDGVLQEGDKDKEGSLGGARRDNDRQEGGNGWDGDRDGNAKQGSGNALGGGNKPSGSLFEDDDLRTRRK
jgi:hypothetical protein